MARILVLYIMETLNKSADSCLC